MPEETKDSTSAIDKESIVEGEGEGEVKVKKTEVSHSGLIDDAASEDEGEEGEEGEAEGSGLGSGSGSGDSSEEDEDEDEDEEAIRKVREGFIVDDDDEDEEGEGEEGVVRRRKHKKRKHAAAGTAEELDEDDLELLRENAGESPSGVVEKSKFKRLKRGADEATEVNGHTKGLTEMFSDEENEEAGSEEAEDDLLEATRERQQRAGMPGEFDDFIEDDELSEDDEDRDERLARMRSARVKNNFAQESQIDQDKMDELYEIFGDGEEYAWALEAEHADIANKEGETVEGEGEDETEEQQVEYDEEGNIISTKPKTSSKDLKDVFEYEELKEHLLTDEDQKIRETDAPERYQLLRQGIVNYDLSDAEFVLKQQWIADKLYEEKAASFQDQKSIWDPFKDAVFHVVEFIARDNLEVPTIWNCRKDYTLHTYHEDDQLRVQKLLNENDLWRVVQLDIEYHALLDKRAGVKKLFESLHVVDPLYDEFVESAKTIAELQDLYDYINFTFSTLLREEHEKQVDSDPEKHKKKLHSRYNVFERIKADPVYDVVKAMGMTADHFGENVSSNTKLYVTEDPEKKPEELIQDAIAKGSRFRTEEKALSSVKHVFSEELSHNPKLRTHLRLAYQNYATVDIELTEKGRVEIGEKSPYADFKYAVNRAMESFTYQPDLFLRMLEAESLGLVHVHIGLKNAYQGFVDHLFTFLSSDGTSDVSNAWNTLRKQCLDLALGKLLPSVALGIKEKLGRDSRRLLFFEVRDRFLDKVDQAPYHPLPEAKGTIPRVLAMSNGDGKRDAAVLAVAMDYDGSVVENVKFEENFREAEFEKKFIALVSRFQPEVIAISGYTPEVSYFFKHVQELVKLNRLVVDSDAAKTNDDYQPDADSNEEPQSTSLPVIYVPNETARVFEHSERAKEEFGDKPRVAKFCIGLARYVQSPLLEYIALGDAITSVSVHKHQDLLTDERFRQAVQTIFVDMSCLVGVKINEAVRSEHLALMVQYIAGLGPRKAAGIIKGIEGTGGAIVRRDDLILKGITTKNVFMNCAPFLELPVPDRYDKDVELLDGTRIHPEDYELARKMASDALDLTDEDRQEIEQEEGGVVGKLYEEGTEKLDDLLLEGYADQLEEHGHRKRATLEMIKEELQNNYEELRKSFHVLDAEEVFNILTSETKDSFQEGQLIPVIIQRVDNRYLSVVTQSGVRGNISRSSIVPYNDPTNLLARYNIGQPVQAVIKSIEYADFRAELSLMREDVVNARRGMKVDRFKGLWDFEAEDADLRREQESEKIGSNETKRFIKHPFFRNFNAQQAEDYLASRENGDFVIRPSSRGPGHLTITWKLDNQLFQHIDVVEHEKLNDFTLGRVLQVGEFRYHDLDELIVSHMNKMHSKVDAMKSYEKFRNEPANDARSWLVRYSKANKNRSCYCFCFNHKAPGWFYLLFKLNDDTDKTYTWNVKVVPTGYQLHGNVYPDMVHLCNGFKKLLQNQLGGGNAGYGYGY
ncbi:DEKNAAC103001 [Brettanomyces naardenensis]|uniref:Transcription elongation factor Spt6 n=1 Tax=Brettanomyces naardenensis TaxID=13370 RepID=A0A448YME7_BRENA|nr:DEKNAAC103001 [Brettanomyces naardenensis]